MSTFSATATKVGYVTNVNSNSWNTKGAFQGQYKGWSGSRVGAIIFDSLRDITWSEQTINRIKLAFTYAAAGANSSKILKIYKGTKNTLTGTGSAMLGDLLGTVSSNGNAYNTTKTITFDADTNSTLFDNLKSYLINGSTKSIALYNAEPAPSSGYSTNYLEVTGATIYVDYEAAGSTGVVSPVPVKVGSTVRCDITRMNATGTVTHNVQWVLGDYRSNVDTVEYGRLYSTFLIPNSGGRGSDWDYAIIDNPSGDYLNRTGQCILTTLVNGVVKATRIIDFVVTLSDNAYPTFTASISGSPYYQNIANRGATLSFGSVSAKKGATVKEYRITGSENYTHTYSPSSSSSTSHSTTISSFSDAGSHEYYFTVVDSRGATTTHTVTITVNATTKPTISTFSVKRCTYDSNSSTWKDSPDGTAVRFTVKASVELASGENDIDQAYISFYYNGAMSPTISNLPSGTTGSGKRTINFSESSPSLVPYNSYPISPNNVQEFTLYIVDSLGNTSSVTASVGKSEVPIHIAGTGYGVGLGMYSNGTSSSKKVQIGWPLYLKNEDSSYCNVYVEPSTNYLRVYGKLYAPWGIWGGDGTRIDDRIGKNKGADITINYGNFEPYDTGVTPTIYRRGYTVELNGIVKPTTTLPPTDSNGIIRYNFFDITDTDYQPKKQVIALMQGSGTAVWLLRIRSKTDANTPGRVTIERYRTGDTYQDMVGGTSPTWLPFHVTWIVD